MTCECGVVVFVEGKVIVMMVDEDVAVALLLLLFWSQAEVLLSRLLRYHAKRSDAQWVCGSK